jgi:hypothetical protein
MESTSSPRAATPALAAADGVVRGVGVTSLGGKVVWLRDEDGHALYYAHLDRQYVTEGQQVRTGDTLGFIGNTGNARTTPPHLHFGIYARGEGPVDPWYFVYRLPIGASPTHRRHDQARCVAAHARARRRALLPSREGGFHRAGVAGTHSGSRVCRDG